ncbi:MAG: Ig-like domain-containing protein [Clostridiales bacterium]|nr:Ig-like domain-containing protein [Clostridiales bacterium]
MMKTSKKAWVVTLIMVVAAVFALSACKAHNKTTPTETGGVYYLSVYADGAWTTYASDDDVPATAKFTQDSQDEAVYTLTVDLDEGAIVKIAQVGVSTTYGGDELFSALDVLSKGEDNAISVGGTGTFDFEFNAVEKAISYKYTDPNGEPIEETPEVESVTIDASATIELTHKEKRQLLATVTYDDDSRSQDGVEWVSSNKAVATVDEDGVVTAVSAGDAQITAKAGGKTSNAITIKVHGTVSLDKTSVTLNVGGTSKVTATLAGGAIKVEWSTANPDVATVDDNGVITAVAAGNTTVRLAYKTRSDANTLFANCDVTVNVPVEKIALSTSSLTVVAGKTDKLNVIFTPDDATNQEYTYTVSEGGDSIIGVAKADKVLTITGKAAGTATVTVKSVDGEYTAGCLVTVVAEGTDVVNIKSGEYSVDKVRLHTSVDKTATLAIEVISDRTVQSVAWTSDATSVATVTASGNTTTVTGVAFGIAAITATVTLESGNPLVKTCKVIVAPDNFFIYGGFGGTTSEEIWTTEVTQLSKQGKYFTEVEDGIYEITVDLGEGSSADFRIGHDDGFTSDWKGLGYSDRDTGAFANMGSGSSDNNIRPSKGGNYTITVDLSGGKAVISVVCNSIAITGMTVTNTGESTLQAGENTTLTLAITPADATYTANDIKWTVDNADVTLTPTEDRKSVTVTANADAKTGNAVVTCTVKGISRTIPLVILAAGDKGNLATSVTFTQSSYDFDVSGGWSDGWTTKVTAETDANATNKNVNYTINGDSALVTIADDGTITAQRLGTYTVTATAADGSGKFDEATVTFYSSETFLSAGHNDWVKSNPAVGDTLKDDGTHKTFTLKIALPAETFQVIFAGMDTNWDSAITSAYLAPGSDANASGNNISVSSKGVYELTLDLTNPVAELTVEYLGAVAATLSSGGSTKASADASVTADNKYLMSVIAELTADTDYTIVVKKGSATLATIADVSSFAGDGAIRFEDSTGAFKCLAAGRYSFDIVCDDQGNCTVTVGLPQDAWVATTAATITVWSDNASSSQAIDGVTTYYNAALGQYKTYFSYTVTANDWFNFYFSGKDLQPATMHSVFTNNATSAFTSTSGYNKFGATATGGTVYFEVVYTNSGSVSFVSVTASTTAFAQPTA